MRKPKQWVRAHPLLHRVVHATYCRVAGLTFDKRRAISSSAGAAGTTNYNNPKPPCPQGYHWNETVGDCIPDLVTGNEVNVTVHVQQYISANNAPSVADALVSLSGVGSATTDTNGDAAFQLDNSKAHTGSVLATVIGAFGLPRPALQNFTIPAGYYGTIVVEVS